MEPIQPIHPNDFMLNLQAYVELTLKRPDSHSTILVKNKCELALVRQLILMRIGNDWLLNLRDCEDFTDVIGCNIRTEEGHTFRIMYTDNQNHIRGLTTSVFCTFRPSEDFIRSVIPVQAACKHLTFMCINENFSE